MKLSDFQFDLPSELIAQKPTQERDKSSLLIPHKNDNEIISFYQIIDQLRSGDLLIFNNSRVINAQLNIVKDTKNINVNLHKKVNDSSWLGFAKPGKKLVVGDEFTFGQHKIIVKNKLSSGDVEFEFILKGINIFDFLDFYGQIPLPQYIKREQQIPEDLERYQTVYGTNKGSVAAATAGLHFTTELLEQIKQKNVDSAIVTLHIGAGTFLPVKSENILDHKMHTEWCHLSVDSAEKINKAKKEGRRIIVVGTTAMRTIESCANNGIVIPQTRETDIFITPGYKFQIADMLLTNFHLPKSTLFMLVCAFSGVQSMHDIYKFAINQRMRFFSYGDAMLLTKNTD